MFIRIPLSALNSDKKNRIIQCKIFKQILHYKNNPVFADFKLNKRAETLPFLSKNQH